MEKIAVINQKGGTGKTTTCVNLAGHLSRKSRVLVLDLDPQASATSGLGVEEEDIDYSLFDIIKSMVSGGEGVHPSEAVLTSAPGPDILPTTLDLAGLISEFYEIDNPVTVLEELLSHFDDDYDFVLIDCPPSYNTLLINAINSSDKFIVPFDTGEYTLSSVEPLRQIFEDARSEIDKDIELKVVLSPLRQKNRFLNFIKGLIPVTDSDIDRTRREIVSKLEDFGVSHESVHVIPYSEDVRRAQEKGIPVTYDVPGSAVSRKYEILASEIVEESKELDYVEEKVNQIFS